MWIRALLLAVSMGSGLRLLWYVAGFSEEALCFCSKKEEVRRFLRLALRDLGKGWRASRCVPSLFISSAVYAAPSPPLGSSSDKNRAKDEVRDGARMEFNASAYD